MYSKLLVFCSLNLKFRTALAESELEYNVNHVSSSVYLKLTLRTPLPECIADISKDAPVYLVVWTTTPWTIPANQAVCYNPDKKYCLVKCKTDKDYKYLVIALELYHSLEQLWSCHFTLIKEFYGNIQIENSIFLFQMFTDHIIGDIFNGHCYSHPFRKIESMPLLPGNHVSVKKGTGNCFKIYQFKQYNK